MGYGSNEFNVQSPTVDRHRLHALAVAVQVDPFESKL
jgi:hypothetical protein